MEQGEKSFNEMQSVKRGFFALRNGVIADVLRRSGSPFRIIFGLNLPQIAEVATTSPHSRELAERLWANTTTRESMLLAPMLIDAEEFTIDDARRWVAEVPAREVADVLCLKLLRREPYAAELAWELQNDGRALSRYTGLRLMFNLISNHTREALDYARKAVASEDDAANLALAKSLEEECNFLLE